ncbi:class II fructose-1,6-bisphosphate aldolase [bacterium]|nr:class II fructose-1,6-bisphosphate aldolase [bacterium]
MLVNAKQVLAAASREGYAVGHFNINNLETIQAIMSGATAKKSPVILAVSKSAIKYAGLDNLVALVRLAAQKADIPVILNLDHGPSVELARECIDAGFTNVMIDTSGLPYADNVAATREVVAYAHERGVSVEAEIGALAGTEDNISVAEQDARYTKVEEAVSFVADTGIDSLAIAIGTAHGVYKGEPRLDFDRLLAIHQAIPETPLVLHGSSGVPAESLREAIKRGIAKINIDTDLRQAFLRTINAKMNAEPESVDLRAILGAGREAIQHTIEAKIDIFGSAGRA